MNVRRLLLIAVFAAVPASFLPAQVRGTRFAISQVQDTTLSFPIGTAKWVHIGLNGIAINPRDRDVLVARFRIVDIDQGVATGLITGMTTRLSTDHVVVLEEPTKRFFKTLGFWGGVVIGFVLGAVAGSIR
jgi:hypothetical protein